MQHDHVVVDHIDTPAKLYRVGNSNNGAGLWYNGQGEETRLIHTVQNAAAAVLPMGPHPIFRLQGKKWISVTTTIEALKLWFPEPDMRQLLARGYQVQEITVTGFARFQFPTYAHEVYHEGQMTDLKIIGPIY